MPDSNFTLFPRKLVRQLELVRIYLAIVAVAVIAWLLIVLVFAL